MHIINGLRAILSIARTFIVTEWNDKRGVKTPLFAFFEILWYNIYTNERDRKVSVPMRYSVCYEGEFFFGDNKGWNEYEARDWNDAYDMYRVARTCKMRAYIKDHDEDVCYEDGKWY